MHFEGSNSKLVIPAKKRWLDKAGRFLDDGRAEVRQLARTFNSILRDLDCTIWTNRAEMQAVPNELYKGAPLEDIYLVQAYICSGADLLITTDQGLFQWCSTVGSVTCRLRDDFLASP